MGEKLADRVERLIRNEQAEKAVKFLEPLVAADPSSVETRVLLSTVYSIVLRPGPAREQAEAAAALAPSNAGPHTAMGIVHWWQGDNEAAETELQLAASLDQGEGFPSATAAWSEFLLKERKDRDRSAAANTEGLQKLPNNPWLLSQRGSHALSQENYRTAWSAYWKRFRVRPNPYTLYKFIDSVLEALPFRRNWIFVAVACWLFIPGLQGSHTSVGTWIVPIWLIGMAVWTLFSQLVALRWDRTEFRWGLFLFLGFVVLYVRNLNIHFE